jgi:type IV secretory pathway VirB4 component
MEIKVDIDEARIIKSVMSGATTKEIENSVINEIKSNIRQMVFNETQSIMETFRRKYESRYEQDLNEQIEKEFKEQFKKLVLPNTLKKTFKTDKFNDLVWDKLNEVIENALEHFTLNLNITTPKGKKKSCGFGETAKGEYERDRK